MENIFKKIDEAQLIIDWQNELNSQKELLMEPALQDTELIPVILERVTDLYNNSPDALPDKYAMRDYFMLVVMLLYCPRVFTGETMNRGLRGIISEVMGVTAPHVSTHVRRVWKWSRYYKDFKEGVWSMYREILSWLDVQFVY